MSEIEHHPNPTELSPAPPSSPEAPKSPEVLLNEQTTAAQTLMLLGIEKPTDPSTFQLSSEQKTQLSKIATSKDKFPPEHRQKITDASLNERDEYWSKQSEQDHDSQMKKWTETMDEFFKVYKEDPGKKTQKEFIQKLLRKDSDQELNEVDISADNLYNTFMLGEGQGDVEFFARKIVDNNTIEEINANLDLIKKLGIIYGDNSAKIAELVTSGLANLKKQPDLFMESAQTNINNNQFGEYDSIWTSLNENSQKWQPKKAEREAASKLPPAENPPPGTEATDDDHATTDTPKEAKEGEASPESEATSSETKSPTETQPKATKEQTPQEPNAMAEEGTETTQPTQTPAENPPQDNPQQEAIDKKPIDGDQAATNTTQVGESQQNTDSQPAEAQTPAENPPPSTEATDDDHATTDREDNQAQELKESPVSLEKIQETILNSKVEEGSGETLETLLSNAEYSQKLIDKIKNEVDGTNEIDQKTLHAIRLINSALNRGILQKTDDLTKKAVDKLSSEDSKNKIKQLIIESSNNHPEDTIIGLDSALELGILNEQDTQEISKITSEEGYKEKLNTYLTTTMEADGDVEYGNNITKVVSTLKASLRRGTLTKNDPQVQEIIKKLTSVTTEETLKGHFQLSDLPDANTTQDAVDNNIIQDINDLSKLIKILNAPNPAKPNAESKENISPTDEKNDALQEADKSEDSQSPEEANPQTTGTDEHTGSGNEINPPSTPDTQATPNINQVETSTAATSVETDSENTDTNDSRGLGEVPDIAPNAIHGGTTTTSEEGIVSEKPSSSEDTQNPDTSEQPTTSFQLNSNEFIKIPDDQVGNLPDNAQKEEREDGIYAKLPPPPTRTSQ